MNKPYTQDFIVQHYDKLSEMSEVLDYYAGSDFLNFGYWDDNTSTQKQACENLMEKLISYIPEKKGKILDVACGKGETTTYLSNYYPPEMITGINISQKQLDIASSKAPSSQFLLMSATDLQFEDNSFDNIICVEAAFHFYTRETFLKEALRVLKPGGWLTLSDVLMTFEGERTRESRTEKNYVENLNGYEQVFQNAGYGNIEIADATKNSWINHYWYAIHYFHHQFLNKQIDRNQLELYLHNTYRRVTDLAFYILAAGMKPMSTGEE